MPALPVLVTAGVALHAFRLRRRLAPLRRVDVAGRGGEPLCWDGTRAAGGGDEPYGLITVDGAVLSGPARRAAAAYARERGLQVLDLVPADLPVDRAFDLARTVDAAAYRTDPVARGRGAGFATIVDVGLLERAGARAGALDAGEYAALTVRLRQYAEQVPDADGTAFAADLAVVPCHTTPRAGHCRARAAWLRGLGVSVARTVGGSMLGYAAVLAALLSDPAWGPVAALAYCAAPYAVFAGTPVSPRDLHSGALLRLVRTPWTWWRTLTGPPSAYDRRRAERVERARRAYRPDLAQGVLRFLEPRRDDCPWCGSRTLRKLLTSGDVVQAKPGRFTVERCGGCGHVFQNPRLTEAGLAFHHRDLSDGLGAEEFERLAAARGGRVHRARAELVAGHLTPRTWLDVGAGHGHFCRTARTVLPGTAFDGLDLGAGIGEAARRGWVRRAHRRPFTEMLDDLAGRYDVVSMHHYLGRRPDPQAELDAAAKVLRPGGHLLIELPDPGSRLGRRLGRFWPYWLQPQHLHLMPMGNVDKALAARGFRVVARERRRAGQGGDLVGTVAVALNAVAPPPERPWSVRPPRPADRARRAAGLAVAAPLLLPALLLDRLLVPLVPGTSNAYRILARKDEG
ncbi:methyltransferase domain-containing protein [Actinomadura sp. J1-007]|nr:methyltransferase domain-containing protein [Actinomadura sp. J1-007]